MARYCGIDLGGTKIQAVVVDEAHEVLGSSRHPTPTTGGPADVALAMIAAVREALDDAGVGPGELTAIGVGSPGAVDDDAGTVTSARNLPDWEGTYPLGEKLETALDAPVAISNDVNVATQAEFELGAGKPYKSILGVFWGTGVGGGIVLDGQMWEGRGAAGEIGHMVVKSDGRKCPCGRTGCMEAYAGRGAMEVHARAEGRRRREDRPVRDHGGARQAAALERHLAAGARPRRQAGPPPGRPRGRGDRRRRRLVAQPARRRGRRSSAAGSGLRLGDPYVEKIRAAMMPHLFADHRPPPVLLASLGDLGGAIGATLLAAGKAPAPA